MATNASLPVNDVGESICGPQPASIASGAKAASQSVVRMKASPGYLAEEVSNEKGRVLKRKLWKSYANDSAHTVSMRGLVIAPRRVVIGAAILRAARPSDRCAWRA